MRRTVLLKATIPTESSKTPVKQGEPTLDRLETFPQLGEANARSIERYTAPIGAAVFLYLRDDENTKQLREAMGNGDRKLLRGFAMLRKGLPGVLQRLGVA